MNLISLFPKRSCDYALATGNPWYIAANLIAQADAYQSLGQYTTAIQTLDEALRIIEHPTNEALVRMKSHLLTCRADNAMMLHDDRTTQEKLEAAEVYLDQIGLDEEFDRAAWLLIGGKYALRTKDYVTAKSRFEAALSELPEQWLLRRVMTETGLVMATARMGERDFSFTHARDLVKLVQSINAPKTNRWFIEYLQQDLLPLFPDDREIREFVAGICR